MIVGRMTPKAGDDPEVAANLKASVEAIVAAEEGSGYRFYLGGGPILNMAFIDLGQHDVGTFTPLVLLIAMALLWGIFRRPSGMLLSISVVIFTFLIVLSIQVLLGYKMNNFTANMPVFVVAIGIADAMHLFWVYLLGRRKGHPRGRDRAAVLPRAARGLLRKELSAHPANLADDGRRVRLPGHLACHPDQDAGHRDGQCRASGFCPDDSLRARNAGDHQSETKGLPVPF